MRFTISESSLQVRKKNIIWGLVFSGMLIVAIGIGHMRYPETYNDVLLWSVAAFVVLGNLINYYRYHRYLRLVRNHWIEVDGDNVEFWTGGEKSGLDVQDISALTVYSRKGEVDHVQVKLRNNRGIRLEGYAELEQLGCAIADMIPAAHVNGRQS